MIRCRILRRVLLRAEWLLLLMSGMIHGGHNEDGVREPLARAGPAHRGSAAWARRSRRRSMSRAPSRRTPSARRRVRHFEVESSIRRGPMALSARVVDGYNPLPIALTTGP